MFYAKFSEFGTAHQPARPFLRPAIDNNQPAIIAKMTEIGYKGLQRELRKQAEAEDPGE